MEALISIFGVIAGIVLFVLALVFVAVPIFKGIGWSIGAFFRFVGWIIAHVFEFIVGVCGDAVRFVGSLLVMLVLLPLVPLNIVIGRWSAAGHFAESFKRECHVGSACVYRAVIRRPLKFLLLDGVLEGLEQRLPEAMAAAPGADLPSRRLGQFDGYRIVGSLRSGGSGAKLYVAEPDEDKRRKVRHMPEQVVIKAFALTEGSSLPQIVRESRALECAKQLGHVLDHGMDDTRFFYVMPYHPGEHLGVLTRQFHAESGGRGLDRERLNLVMSYSRDLLSTLSAYHHGGLWHKDVKPENVIVHDGRAHLVDLGLVTPLRSAMTLTTHGTEYFRDPEMVRQALRGVKVHQVDGAKFDIYAAGAVLYFMIENTFPAHGGLSRITQPSPEALRWIVRRAMTDYHQRYATAAEMLRDLEHVMYAGNPVAVKPADLPSMRGVAPGQQPSAGGIEDTFAGALNVAAGAVASAATAVGAAFGPKAGAGVASAGAAAGLHVDPAAAAAAAGGAAAASGDAASAKRPRIVVTNWWSGAYRVEGEDGGAAASADSAGDVVDDRADARLFRRHASAFRHQSDHLRAQVRGGAMSARRAAREQIRAARQRAREIRSRAMAHRRHVAGRHPSMSPWLFVIGFFTLALLAGGLLVGTMWTRNVVRSGGASASVVAQKAVVPLLLVVESRDYDHPRVQERLARTLNERARQGYHVVTSTAKDQDLRTLVNQWWKDRSGPADEALEDLLEAKNAYGVLHVKIDGDSRRPVKSVTEQLVHSTRPGAKERRRVQVEAIVPSGPAPREPYLLINDHPAKADPEVEAVINETLARYREKGWQLEVADDVEVQVRKLLPMGPIESAASLPFMLREVLEQSQIGGVLRIDAAAGDGKPRERVIVTIIRREDVPKLSGAPEGPTADSERAPAAGALATQPG